MTRRARLACLLFFLHALLLAAAAAAEAPPPRGDLQLVTCPRTAGEYLATLSQRLVLHRAFLAGGADEDEDIRRSVKLQLRNLWGYVRNSEAGRRAYRLVLSGEEPAIVIRKKTAGRYGRDLTIDWSDTSERLGLTSPYLRRAAARGRTRADDEALLVDYEARFAIELCGQGEEPGPTLQAALPDDPWLLFFHVPAAARRPMSYLEYEAVTTPCSAPDFAELPNPEYYWYDWQPDRRGPDARGRPFDCRELLRPGVDYRPVSVPLRLLSRPSFDFTPLRRALSGPVQATVLVGIVDHQVSAPPLAALRRALHLGDAGGAGAAGGEGGKGEGQVELARAAAAAEQISPERGTRELLGLLRELPRLAAVRAVTAAVEDGFLRVEVTGRLLRSGRPLRLRAYLGLTDVLGFTPPRHWPILWRALAEDNLIVYAGHSGLGDNFRLARIEQGVGRSHDEFLRAYRKAPFQVVAFLSCYSYMYFGQDLLAASSERAAASSQFVFTGTEYTRGDRGSLALLGLIDEALAPDGDGKVRSLRFLDPQEILIVKHLPLPGAHR